MQGSATILNDEENQPIRLPGLKLAVCSGLMLSGAFYPDLKIGVWRRRTYQEISKERTHGRAYAGSIFGLYLTLVLLRYRAY